MAIVILQTDQRQYGRADIGMIGPGSVVDANFAHARPDHAEPGGNDFRLHITMVPGETWVLRDKRRRRRATEYKCIAHEVIGIGEQCVRWCSGRIGCHHMEYLHLYRIRQELGKGVSSSGRYY